MSISISDLIGILNKVHTHIFLFSLVCTITLVSNKSKIVFKCSLELGKAFFIIKIVLTNEKLLAIHELK